MAEFRNSGKPEQTVGKHGLAHFSRKRPARILPTASCQPGTPTPGSGLRVRSYSGRRVSPEHQARIVRLLDVLDAAAVPEDMNLPGFYFHRLRGRLTRYSVRVSANWRLTFAWEESDATQVDLEDYH
jgi:proteic killer suppression protein